MRAALALSLGALAACAAALHVSEEGDAAAAPRGAEFLGTLAERLAHDTIWSVRKGVAESVAAVARVAAPELRTGALCEAYAARLLADDTRWVRNAALAQIGAFLLALAAPARSATDAVPRDATAVRLLRAPSSDAAAASVADAVQRTVEALVACVDAAEDSGAKADTDVPLLVAYNFPAILYVAGAAHWDTHLRKLYRRLLRSVQWKTRRTLAYSLGAVASMIAHDDDLEQKMLGKAMDIFLADADEVRLGAVRSLSALVAAQPRNSDARRKYLTSLSSLAADPVNMRVREAVAEQCVQLSKLYK